MTRSRVDLHSKMNVSLLFLLSFICFGGIWTWVYIDIPVVRNSIIYGAIAQAISDYGLWASQAYAKNKPLGFPVLSWPLVESFGVTRGLKIASFFCTALWCVVVFLFLKRLSVRFSEDKKVLLLSLVIALFNPLIFYQFFSGYPDTFFAALFLAALVCYEKALSLDSTPLDVVCGALLTLSCIWVKHHGFILLPIFVLILVMRRKEVLSFWASDRRQLFVLALCSISVLCFLFLAQNGKVPLFNLGHNVKNFSSGHSRFGIITENCSNFLTWGVVSFGVLFPIILSWRTCLKRKHLVLCVLIFVLPILFYKGARYNIRYFIAIAPILSWLVAEELSLLRSRTRGLWLAAFLLVNTLTILNYNSIFMHKYIARYVELPEIDNLRLVSEQLREKENLALIAQYADEYDSTLIYLSQYYSRATFGVWENDGLFPKGLNVIYEKKWKHRYLKEHNIQRALIYEYLTVDRSRNGAYQDKLIRGELKELTPQLYLYERGEVPS